MCLFSIQLNSNRPQQIVLFFDNIEETADRPQDIEVLLHIDKGDSAMETLVNAEKARRRFKLRVFDSDLVKGYETLWKPLNLLWEKTDPNAYFILNISDEMLFLTKGWDTIVKQYIGYYPDHVFRLRASKYRHRNYTDFWECGYAPDSIAFYTRKWLELSGDWNPCLGPDSFQQCVAFYLFTSDPFSHTQHCRDIPLTELRFTGEGAGIGLEGLAKYKRILVNNRAWFVLMSHRMQKEAKRRAMHMKAYILSQLHPTPESLKITEQKDAVLVMEAHTGKSLHTLSFHLSRLRIAATNFWRMREVHYYAGGGVRARRYPFAGYFVMAATYMPYGAEAFYRLSLMRPRFAVFRRSVKHLLLKTGSVIFRTLSLIPVIGKMLTLFNRPEKKSRTAIWKGIKSIPASTPSALSAPGDMEEQTYFSIQLSSNRPRNVIALLQNIEDTATNPRQVEVLVHIDTGDHAMESMLREQMTQRKVKIKYIATDLVKGFTHLWKAYNPLYKETSPSAYFVTLFSDEMRFETKGWDTVLRSYEGYYPDHIFRVRCSKYRFRNYTDYWENGFAPDSLAFYTRKWMDLQGDWNPCTGPDSFQQCVAFYLFTADPFSHTQHHRDITAPFLQFSGEGGSVGLEGEARRKRIRENNREWFSLMSHAMQENARRRAMLMKADIISLKLVAENPGVLVEVKENTQTRRLCISSPGREDIVLSYRLNRYLIGLTTLCRAPWVHYYAGGGAECMKTHPWGGIYMMLDTYSPAGRKLIAGLVTLRASYGNMLRFGVHTRNHLVGTLRHHGLVKGPVILAKQLTLRCLRLQKR